MQNEKLFRTIFENLTDGVLVIDSHTRRLLVANPAFFRMTGYTAEELLSIGVDKLHPPESLSFVLDRFRESAEGAPPAAVDIPVLKKDGTKFYVNISLSPVLFGQRASVIVIFRDASGRRSIDKELLRKTEELDQYFELSVDLLCITDSDGCFRRLNPTWESVLGYSGSFLIGKKILDLVHPDDLEHTSRSITSGWLEPAVIDCTARFRHQNGTWRWIEWRSSPKGNLMYAVARDITERKEAETGFRERTMLFEAVFNTSPIGISITRAKDGLIVDVNPMACKLYGWAKEEALGKTTTDLGLWLDLSDQAAVLEALKAGGRLDNWKARLGRKDGTFLQASLFVRPLMLAGEPHFMVLTEDIADRQRLADNLMKTQYLESLGLLAGGIAHDFNNLLSGIFGNIDLARLELETGGIALAMKYLCNSMEVLDRTRDLTGQLLTFAKGGGPTKKKGDIEKTVRDSVLFAVTGSSVKADIESVGGVWKCDYDVNQIGQVIKNIVINAKQAMPGGGALHVRVENILIEPDSGTGLTAGPFIGISIKDFGTGISNSHLPKIFDPFFTTQKFGSGLGLATAWSIVKRHGGHIDVSSELGKGTTFLVYLPATMQVSLPQERAKSIETEGSRREGRVLIMDDEDYIREVATGILVSFGYSVDVASDGIEAINKVEAALAEGDPFVAVILDLTIPGGLGGRETLPLIRAIDPDVRAVASSGYADDPVMAAPRSFGFDASLIKPYHRDEAAATMARVILDRRLGGQ